MSSLSQLNVQKTVQKLSPQQVQIIKLLELPSMLLEQRIKEEIESNPVLDEDSDNNSVDDTDDASTDEYLKEDDIPNYKYYTNNYSPDDERHSATISDGMSLNEYVRQQLDYKHLTEIQEVIAEYIIGNLDDDGYLRRSTDVIVDDIAFTRGLEVAVDQVDEVLYMIQELEPPGIGARDLQECLLLQLESKDSPKMSAKLAREIIVSHFDEFSKKHYEKMLSRFDVETEQLRAAIAEITSLSPRPGNLYSGGRTIEASAHITPDFLLDYKNGEFELQLNHSNIPDLKINSDYLGMVRELSAKGEKQSDTDKETVLFIKHKIESARWFISAIKQRHNTLRQTMQSILDYQHDYFIDGDFSKLRPMILKDIAERTGLDISTISRVVNSKYIQTHFGILSLKSLFSESMRTESGDEVSSYEIKQILSDCVDSEDKKKPLTDEVLMDILNEKGYRIARRTVAKYREMMGIPVARLRKEI